MKRRKTPKVKYMTEDQLKRIIENNYCGDPSKGYGFDYGADLKEEIDQRLWEVQQNKAEKELEEYLKQMEQKEFDDIPENHFSCYYCKEIKEFSELKKGSFRAKRKRGKCKKCHALKIRIYKNELESIPF